MHSFVPRLVQSIIYMFYMFLIGSCTGAAGAFGLTHQMLLSFRDLVFWVVLNVVCFVYCQSSSSLLSPAHCGEQQNVENDQGDAGEDLNKYHSEPEKEKNISR